MALSQDGDGIDVYYFIKHSKAPLIRLVAAIPYSMARFLLVHAPVSYKNSN